MCTYSICHAIEQTLRNQIIGAIAPDFFDALRNADTNIINEIIPAIITFL